MWFFGKVERIPRCDIIIKSQLCRAKRFDSELSYSTLDILSIFAIQRCFKYCLSAEDFSARESIMEKILIIEDNPSNMKLAALVLEKAGFCALKANNARAGMEVAKNDMPDLILMDIQLPGIDGLAATKMLKDDSQTSKIKVIAMTAFAMAGDEERIRAAGCDGYISKPIRYTQLVDQIRLQVGFSGGNNVQ